MKCPLSERDVVSLTSKQSEYKGCPFGFDLADENNQQKLNGSNKRLCEPLKSCNFNNLKIISDDIDNEMFRQKSVEAAQLLFS